MQLIRFSNQIGARALQAEDLDNNFARLTPLPNDGSKRQYAITETPQGWKLELFLDSILPTIPNATLVGQSSLGIYVLVANNQTTEWKELADVQELVKPTAEAPITEPGSVDTTAVSVIADKAVFVTRKASQFPALAAWPEQNQVVAAWTESAPPNALLIHRVDEPGQDGKIAWSDAPPSGTPGWKQVERCDGQTMYVWGTDWEPSS